MPFNVTFGTVLSFKAKAEQRVNPTINLFASSGKTRAGPALLCRNIGSYAQNSTLLNESTHISGLDESGVENPPYPKLDPKVTRSPSALRHCPPELVFAVKHHISGLSVLQERVELRVGGSTMLHGNPYGNSSLISTKPPLLVSSISYIFDMHAPLSEMTNIFLHERGPDTTSTGQRFDSRLTRSGQARSKLAVLELYEFRESSKLQNHLPPGPPYALSLMKPRSLFSEYMNEREGACTQRKSAVTPTASETARTGVTTRRSKYQRMPFTPSPPPASSLTIKDLYPQFHKLFRHTFGRKISPFRQQSQTWLRSLGKKSTCSNCQGTRWKCDSKELRCGACSERHATCPRTLQFKKIFIMRELRITEDVYDELLKLVPQRRNSRNRGVGSSSSAHPPTRQSHQVGQKSKQKQVISVVSEAESEEGMDSEEEVDELDPSELSSDDIPIQSVLSSNHSAPIPIPLLSPGPPYVNRSMEAIRMTQVRPDRVIFPTTHRGPMPPPTSTPKSAPSSAPMATVRLDSDRVVNELSGIRLALTRIEETMSKFLSNHASAQAPGMTDRGTHLTLSNPSPPIVSESLPVPTESQTNIVGTEIRGEISENGIGEQQRQGPTDDQILGGSSDWMMEGSFMTPPHVLPTIITLEGREIP
ncbi:hypothetical protein Agabi119p4_8360 [Agaricus bisporus var. burnettii]|uniref:Zn(2)-C6 fungal-type domain-containing protein n=1 Tax=Agaricus bisporus var. burnettii TaxID=192524 RepID=A0A8H7C7U0_AGABI|nr:hypothetical protein Agabi119p4_8360 [Agaricus bisporus var. burnettii]